MESRLNQSQHSCCDRHHHGPNAQYAGVDPRIAQVLAALVGFLDEIEQDD
jgi:hypothetical protein